jgi:hypothetical protein
MKYCELRINQAKLKGMADAACIYLNMVLYVLSLHLDQNFTLKKDQGQLEPLLLYSLYLNLGSIVPYSRLSLCCLVK